MTKKEKLTMAHQPLDFLFVWLILVQHTRSIRVRLDEENYHQGILIEENQKFDLDNTV